MVLVLILAITRFWQSCPHPPFLNFCCKQNCLFNFDPRVTLRDAWVAQSQSQTQSQSAEGRKLPKTRNATVSRCGKKFVAHTNRAALCILSHCLKDDGTRSCFIIDKLRK